MSEVPPRREGIGPVGSTRRDIESPRVGPPLWLLAELTYRCPLHCVFCYNPVDYAKQHQELGTQEWIRVLREARQLGAVQLGLSGGEPLLREDLEEIVREARALGYYSNLLTSGIGLTEARIAALKDAGLGIAYGLYTAAAVLSPLVVLRFVRETKGKQLEEM